MRLIDADALIEENKSIIDCEIEHPKYQNTVREIIDSAPTIEIVHCSECEYWNNKDCRDGVGECEWAYYMTKPSDFCSYGEGREPC